MPQMDREGRIKASVIELGIYQSENSAAVMVNGKFLVMEFWNGTEWEDWLQYSVEVYGSFCIVKKDGDIMEQTVASLKTALSWTGDLGDIESKDWRSVDVQLKIKADEYKGVTRYKAAYINPVDYEPTGTVGNTSQDSLKALKARLNSKLKAVQADPPQAKPAGEKKADDSSIPF